MSVELGEVQVRRTIGNVSNKDSPSGLHPSWLVCHDTKDAASLSFEVRLCRFL